MWLLDGATSHGDGLGEDAEADVAAAAWTTNAQKATADAATALLKCLISLLFPFCSDIVADDLAVVEWVLHAGYLLRRLVALAGDDHHVVHHGIRQRIMNRCAAVRLDEHI